MRPLRRFRRLLCVWAMLRSAQSTMREVLKRNLEANNSNITISRSLKISLKCSLEAGQVITNEHRDNRDISSSSSINSKEEVTKIKAKEDSSSKQTSHSLSLHLYWWYFCWVWSSTSPPLLTKRALHLNQATPLTTSHINRAFSIRYQLFPTDWTNSTMWENALPGIWEETHIRSRR